MSLLPYLEANRIEAGCDEVGRGCLAGPVVAAAVVLPQDYSNPWINDSKKLTKTNREELIEVADLVTEMTEIKHPFRSGVKAQPGIEF